MSYDQYFHYKINLFQGLFLEKPFNQTLQIYVVKCCPNLYQWQQSRFIYTKLYFLLFQNVLVNQSVPRVQFCDWVEATLNIYLRLGNFQSHFLFFTANKPILSNQRKMRTVNLPVGFQSNLFLNYNYKLNCLFDILIGHNPFKFHFFVCIGSKCFQLNEISVVNYFLRCEKTKSNIH